MENEILFVTHLAVTDEMKELLAPLLDLDKQDWVKLELLINYVQNNFVQRLRKDYPCLSEDDIQIILLIRAGLTHREMSKVGNVQLKSFRMRLWQILESREFQPQNAVRHLHQLPLMLFIINVILQLLLV